MAKVAFRFGCAKQSKNLKRCLIRKPCPFGSGLKKFAVDFVVVIFYQWSKLHLGLDALSNQKILNGI